MAPIVPSVVVELIGLVGNTKDGTPANYAEVYIEATTTATSNTIDLSTYIPCTAIKQITAETVDEAVAATSSTWSSTTVTLAGHTGSGRFTGRYLITQ